MIEKPAAGDPDLPRYSCRLLPITMAWCCFRPGRIDGPLSTMAMIH